MLSAAEGVKILKASYLLIFKIQESVIVTPAIYKYKEETKLRFSKACGDISRYKVLKQTVHN